MATHLYIKGLTGAQRYAPIKANGEPYQRISKKMAEADGARIGITTQIGNHLDTGFLFNWASKLGQQAAFDAAYEYVTGVLGHEFTDWPEATIGLAKDKFKKASTAAADRGTEIHDGLDDYSKNGELHQTDKVIATSQKEVCAWLAEKGVDMLTVKAEHCVIFEGGITCEDGRVLEIKNGATADLITRSLLADYKTVEMRGGKYYTGKPEHAAQLAFCRHAGANDDICDRDAKCFNVYIDRKTGSIVHVREWKNEELDAALEFVGACYECDKAKAKLEGMIKQ